MTQLVVFARRSVFYDDEAIPKSLNFMRNFEIVSAKKRPRKDTGMVFNRETPKDI